MPISFINPAFLFGGLAAALPVIIHFLSRKKVQKQKFSDLRFLDEVQARQARSLGIRRWLLLLLRVLAILAIAVAISGPRWGGLAAGAAGSRSLIFIIDNSASMSTQQDGGTRFETALADCSVMMRTLPAEASVQVIVAGSRTYSLFGDWLPAGTGVVSGLTGIRPSDGAFDLAAVIQETSTLVARAPSQPVDVVLISDFQLNPLPDDLKNAAERLLAAGTARIITHHVGEATAGGGIQDVILPGRALQPGESADIRALVTSNLPDQVFSLVLDGNQVAEAVLAEPSNTPVPLVFSISVPGSGLHNGLVRKPSDAFGSDDERPFVLSVPSELTVLIVHGPDRPVDPLAGRGGWRYLSQALAPGSENGLFQVKEVSSTELTSGDLSAAAVVVFIDPEPLGRRTSDALRLWLEAGGAAAFLLGDPTLAGYLDSSLLPLLGLSSGVEPMALQPGQHQRLEVLDPGHPIFAGLGLEAVTTFEDIIWSRWLKVPSGQADVILAMSDESPLLLTGHLAQGRFALMPCNLLPAAGKIATSPMALPFFQRLVSWLATGGLNSAAVNVNVGQRASITPVSGTSTLSLENTAQLMILNQSGEPGQNADLVWQGDTPHLLGDVLDRAGFVTFLSGDDTLGIVAAQVPAEESMVGLWSPVDWARQLDLHGLEVQGQLGAGQGVDLVGTLNGQDLASWFFGLALLLLMFELYVGRGTSRKA